MASVQVQSKAILMVGCVRGLVSEGERASCLVKEHEPDVLGFSISAESLQALGAHIRDDKDDVEVDTVDEELYVLELKRFGEVRKPPPCFSEAWKKCAEMGVDVVGLDMDEEHFTDAYCKHISGMEMLMLGRREKKLAKHKFVSATPEEFVLEWDGIISRTKGFRALELEREKVMAKRMKKLLEKKLRPMAVIELERMAGIESELKRQGCDYRIL